MTLALKIMIPVLVLGLGAAVFTGCAATSRDPFETRLTTMSDADLLTYYHAINDRLKAIQEGTRAEDRQGTIMADDHLAKMPYVIGGEAWELEQRRERVQRELNRRNLTP